MSGVIDACRGLIGWALAFSVGVNLLYLAPSLYMMQIYDRVLVTGGITTLWLLSAVLVFSLATLGALDIIRNRLMVRVGLRLNRLVAPTLLENSLRAPVRTGKPERLQIMREFDTFRQTLAGPAATAVMDAPWAPLYVIVCFLIHPMIGLATVVGGALLVLLALANQRETRAALAKAGELAPAMYAAQETEGASAEAARVMGMRRALVARQMAARSELDAVQTDSQLALVRNAGLMRTLRIFLQSAVLGIGAWLAVERQISPGALIASSILASRALAPLEQIVGAWRPLVQARAAFLVLKQTMDASDEPQRTALQAPRGALTCEHVVVRLPNLDRPALVDVHFAVAPGEVVGVTGPSGAGKSTLARVACGALAPDMGVVRLDGANLLDWDRDALGVHIGYLPQDISLLAGTIADNISRFAPLGARDEAVGEAARAAGAHDMIQRLPLGYDTMLGAGGRGLSFGQAQRIALARALYGRPALLVLDEPNAHLDADGEAALLGALRAAKARGAAIMIIVHKMGLLELADRILVLREGYIEASGPRDEIVSRIAAHMAASKTPVLRPVQS